jgi:hypothetical protein
MRGANCLGAGFQLSGRRAPLHLAKKISVVLKSRGHVGVIWAECFLHDGERPPVGPDGDELRFTGAVNALLERHAAGERILPPDELEGNDESLRETADSIERSLRQPAFAVR